MMKNQTDSSSVFIVFYLPSVIFGSVTGLLLKNWHKFTFIALLCP